MNRRRSGLLLHITSLPSRFGIGDLGPEAYEFADFLARARQSLWQILPLNPTRSISRHSPYDCAGAFAGNPLLISPELLVRDNLLTKEEITPGVPFQPGRADYHKASRFKNRLFELAFARFTKRNPPQAYERFCIENRRWLDDHAVFTAFHRHFKGACWSQWPPQFRTNPPLRLPRDNRLARDIEKQKFLQYIFFKQWFDLKAYCNRRGIRIIGDVPFYVAGDSADVWANRDVFKLTETGKSLYVAGAPPDLFSKAGQRWGNPVYNWPRLKDTAYRWWIERLRHNLRLFDIVRLDHFRGFVAYWQIPAHSPTAKTGRWIPGPGEDFFDEVAKHLGSFPLIVEDLGHITPDVIELIDRLGLCGMRVLQFAFDPDDPNSPHLPHNHVAGCVVYTGTHDNNTVRGWFECDATGPQIRRLCTYLGRKVTRHSVHRHFIRMALASVARTAIIPVQDLLGLPGGARMNHPGRKTGNWRWRLSPGQLTGRVADKLAELTESFGRA